MKWTDSAIMRLKVESERTFTHPSKPGLRLRVYPNGTKNFHWKRNVAGKATPQPLGPFPLHSAKDAERWADDLNEAFEAGKSVLPPPRMTVAEGWERYIKELRRRERKSILKRDGAGMLDIVGKGRESGDRTDRQDGTIGHKFIKDVTPEDVRNLIDRPRQRSAGCTEGRVRSNYLLSLTRQFFKFCDENEYDSLSRNPARAVKPIVSIRHRPQRVLSVREMALLILAAREYDKLRGQSLADPWTVMVMNGNRKNEVYKARSREWDSVSKVWTIGDVRYKTNADCVLPVGPTSAAIFDRLATVDDNYIFPQQTGVRHCDDNYIFLKHIRPLMERIDGAPVPHFTAHAIRYGFRTNIRRLRIADSELAERITHPARKLAMSEHYDPEMVEEKRAALAAWDRMLNTEIASIVAERMRIVA